MPSKERIFGLDLLRATAVLLVIFHHSLFFATAPKWLYSFCWVGEIGVGALLVLSGYLIGQGLIKKCKEGRFSQFSHLGQFYLRRWSRTFPPYYFYLGMMAALLPPFVQQLQLHWSYFFFLQNFAWNVPLFYAQTWTLTLLEFFYLLFPLLLIITSKFIRNYFVRIAVPMVLLFFIPLTLRATHTEIESAAGIEDVFRKWVIFRLDTPIIGVVAALVQAELPSLWAWFLRRSWIGCCGLATVSIYHHLGCPYLYSNHWMQVFFYPVSALAIAPLLPFLCNWKFNHSLLGSTISSISQVSYTLYVSHMFALTVGFALLFMLGISHASWFLAYPLYILLIVLIACPSYYLVEEPFIRLRESGSRSWFLPLYRYSCRTLGTFFAGWAPAVKPPSRPLTNRPTA